jgi:hypothetical protein
VKSVAYMPSTMFVVVGKADSPLIVSLTLNDRLFTY